MGRRPSDKTIDTLRATIEQIEIVPDLPPDAPVTGLKSALLRRIVDLDLEPETLSESPNQPDAALGDA
jgi:hypothetical protein